MIYPTSFWVYKPTYGRAPSKTWTLGLMESNKLGQRNMTWPTTTQQFHGHSCRVFDHAIRCSDPGEIPNFSGEPPCPWRSAWEDLPIPRLWHGASFRILQGDNGDLIEVTRHLNLTNINQPKSGSSSLNVVISLKLINETGDLNSKQQGFNCWTCSFKGDFTKANIDIYVSRRNCDIKI